MELKEIINQKLYRTNSNNLTTTNSIELPEVITKLIVGEAFRQARINRYKMLIRNGYKRELFELAAKAQEMNNPAHWFAKWASKKRWEQTLETLKKWRKEAPTIREIIERLQVKPNQNRVAYKAFHEATSKHKSPLQLAITAQETGRDAFKYFCWLVWKT